MSDTILNIAPPPADLRIAYGADRNQFGDLRLPKGNGPFPVVMNIHGGFWRAMYDLDSTSHLCSALTGKGFATWNLEYRRVGNPGGGWPGTFADVRDSFRFLSKIAKAHKLDMNRVLVMGHSAGGQLALCLAGHEPSLKRVISLAGVVDLHRAYSLHLNGDVVVELLGGSPNTVPEHYQEADPMQLSIAHARQYLIHGLADDIVPPDFSRSYVREKTKRAEDAHLLEIAEADHFDLIDPRSSAWKPIFETVASLTNLSTGR